MQTAIACSIMRGGTSKGLYFLASDLPSEPAVRDRALLAALGSPDLRQIDGMGGAHPLTSKVAIVSVSDHADVDVDYLFLQVSVDRPDVSDSQPCGNLLAGVGPYAIEKGLVAASEGFTDVRIRTANNGAVAVARVQTPDKRVTYVGDAQIDGVPGSHAPITIDYLDIAGTNCGALLPTGNARDVLGGLQVTCIDNGMPVVLLRAADLGLTGYETPIDLESDGALRTRLEAVRIEAGRAMNLGDVAGKTVPKMTIIAAPRHGGAISTRTFIPHRVHEAIGVLGAISVATGALLPGSVADGIADQGDYSGSGARTMDIEHPSGFFTVDMEIEQDANGFRVKRSALLRTARMLMDGRIFIPASVWSGA